MTNNIEKAILDAIAKNISERLDREIAERSMAFHKELTSRKDDYIAEVMKGIRIVHEQNPEGMYTDYRILFVNKYEISVVK